MSVLRISGIASGMDTQQIVHDLMKIERMKADRIFQQKQVQEWQKEQFRDITNQVRVFRDKHFNTAQASNNLMSTTSLKQMTAFSSHVGVSVTANANAISGDSSFKVMHSATAAKATATAVSLNSADGARLSLNDTMEAVSTKLDQDFNFNEEGQFTLTLNDTELTINKTDTLSSVINKINTSNANVTAHYSTFSDTFTLTAKNTGEGHMTTDDGGNFFTALGLTPGSEGEIGASGRDASFEINGHAGTRATNTFLIDGINYNINTRIDEPTTEMTITVNVDHEGTYNKIESFVNDYNELIDMINSKTREEHFRDFPPLTNEQKDAMSEKDIEKWEEKAQSGLLKGDSTLQQMTTNMRQALYELVGDFHLSEIGIETSRNYLDQGKLVLREDGNALRNAISANPDKVADIFTRRSSIAYSPSLSSDERTQRRQESGLAHRISDIINDNIRTLRDNNGRKGLLIEKAGIEGDVSEFNNFIDKKIAELNKRLDQMNQIFARREEQYYRQFTAMEKALSQLHAQGDWFMAQLNQGF